MLYNSHRPAIMSLQEMDPVDIIWLGKTFHTTVWLLLGYGRLVARQTALSEDESQKLGLNTVIRLF